MTLFSRSHLNIEIVRSDKACGARAAQFTRINEQRRTAHNAESACRIDFEMASGFDSAGRLIFNSSDTK